MKLTNSDDTMYETLEQNPHQMFQFTEAGDARPMLIQLGFDASLLPESPPNAPCTHPCKASLLFGGTPTHFMLVLLYLGHPDPEKNGYQVLCFPKSKLSYAEFEEDAMRFTRVAGDRITGVKLFGTASPDN